MSVAVQAPVANGHINGVVGDLGSTNGVGTPNGDAVNETAGPSVRFATGLILPPPEIKSSIDRTALYVARSSNPIQFEDKIRESKRTDPKFSFLNPADPYHEYYRHRLDRISAGENVDANGATVDQNATPVVEMDEEPELDLTSIAPKEPPPADFTLNIPPINAVDLDIIKLTALFTAQRGRSFLASLSTREGRNYEFDFLSPNHSLFGLFNSLVEQYTRILLPPQDYLEKLKAESLDENTRWKKLELARQYAEWERIKREKEKKKQDDKEAERIAFAEIDWYDYAIVQTIEFTVADANTELPPPMTVAEMESMTLAQKKMAVMILENTVDEVEAHKAKQAAAEADAAAAAAGVGVSVGGAGDDGAMEESDDEETQERRRQQEEERRRELERIRSMPVGDTSGAMKIRTDYVPKLGGKNAKSQMTTCTICGQQIPVDELQEHMRIELLDPRWKSQRDSLEMRKAQASELQRGANVEASLRGLARARVDIFGTEADEEARKREEAEQAARRKEREKVVWDGHTASKDKTLDKFQTSVNFEEQIAAIHRAKGLAPVDSSGPGIGPNLAPAPLPTLPPPPPSLPTAPHLVAAASLAKGGDLAAATIASGPQPSSGYSATPPIPTGTPTAPTPTPVVLPPLHYQGLNAPQPFGYQPPVGMTPMGMHPARFVALEGNAPVAGMVRTADQMEGVTNGGDDIPPAKRQRVAKLPGGQYYPEQDWANLHPHPISLQVQLPVDETKPEWKLDGSVVTLSEIPVTYFVSTLRDHIVRQTGGSIPPGRIMLFYNGKPLRNSDSLAVYNLEDEDMLTLSVRDAKKKK